MSRNQREGRWRAQAWRGIYIRSEQREFLAPSTRRDRKADRLRDRQLARGASHAG